MLRSETDPPLPMSSLKSSYFLPPGLPAKASCEGKRELLQASVKASRTICSFAFFFVFVFTFFPKYVRKECVDHAQAEHTKSDPIFFWYLDNSSDNSAASQAEAQITMGNN